MWLLASVHSYIFLCINADKRSSLRIRKYNSNIISMINIANAIIHVFVFVVLSSVSFKLNKIFFMFSFSSHTVSLINVKLYSKAICEYHFLFRRSSFVFDFYFTNNKTIILTADFIWIGRKDINAYIGRLAWIKWTDPTVK